MISKEYIKKIYEQLTTGSKSPIVTFNYKSAKSLKMSRLEYLTYKIKLEFDKIDKNINIFLNQEIKDNFNILDIYNYIYSTSNICSVCKKEKYFKSCAKGYDNCPNEKYHIFGFLNKKDMEMHIDKLTLKEIFNKLTKISYYHHYNRIISFLKTHDILCKLFDFNKIHNMEDLYLYVGYKKHYCKICGKPTKFLLPFSNRIYKQFCSNKCRNIWWKKCQEENNTSKRMTTEQRIKSAEKQSNTLKEKIKKGKFTPNITNSWCHSKYIIKFLRNDILIIQKMRSTWEVMFQLMNPNLEYEKIRIPYIGKDNKFHLYIVDFIDYENKILFEIKPKSFKQTKNNILKWNALEKWCKDNGYLCKYIDEEYFQKNIFYKSLLKYTEQIYINKFEHIIKHKVYKNFLIYEDQENNKNRTNS